ncbi:hypothetical protein RFI_33943, partial [Reticulomyxa filosa]
NNNNNNNNKRLIPGMEDVKTNHTDLSTGDRFMVIDMGGGTVDIACHEIVGDYKVKELLAPSGGAWGSTYIDKNLVHFLYQIFGETEMRKFQSTHPDKFAIFENNIESAKINFCATRVYRPQFYGIDVPPTFTDFMLDTYTTQAPSGDDNSVFQFLQAKVKSYSFNNTSGLFDYDGRYLNISTKVWNNLFDSNLKEIFGQIEKLLISEVFKKQPLKYMFLAGGFACSKYVQEQFKIHFKDCSFRIIIPQYPLLSVVDGAAQLGKRAISIEKQAAFVTSHIMPRTYGIRTCWGVDRALAHPKVKSFVKQNTFFSDVSNEMLVKNCFSVFVKQGESVSIDK